MAQDWWHEWTAWWAGLAPESTFLLLLPFAIAGLGLLAHAWRGSRDS